MKKICVLSVFVLGFTCLATAQQATLNDKQKKMKAAYELQLLNQVKAEQQKKALLNLPAQRNAVGADQLAYEAEMLKAKKQRVQ